MNLYLIVNHLHFPIGDFSLDGTVTIGMRSYEEEMNIRGQFPDRELPVFLLRQGDHISLPCMDYNVAGLEGIFDRVGNEVSYTQEAAAQKTKHIRHTPVRSPKTLWLKQRWKGEQQVLQKDDSREINVERDMIVFDKGGFYCYISGKPVTKKFHKIGERSAWKKPYYFGEDIAKMLKEKEPWY